MSSRQPLASVAVTAIRKGDIVALRQALQQDPALSTPQLADSAPSSTSPPTGPATFPTTPPASRNWSRPAPTSTRLSSAAIPKRRSTGLPAPMTSRCSIPCSIMVPISKPLAAPSVAERHWRMRLPSGNGNGAAAGRAERPNHAVQTAALRLMPRVTACFADAARPAQDDVTNTFWCACHGGQRQATEFLLERGAELNWVGHDGLTPLDAASRGGADQLVTGFAGKARHPLRIIGREWVRPDLRARFENFAGLQSVDQAGVDQQAD